MIDLYFYLSNDDFFLFLSLHSFFIFIFLQNLGEAEYAVALFTYMRILGYPHDKISIITTYNGQASLLRDVVQRRCAENPLIGVPHKVIIS